MRGHLARLLGVLTLQVKYNDSGTNSLGNPLPYMSLLLGLWIKKLETRSYKLPNIGIEYPL